MIGWWKLLVGCAILSNALLGTVPKKNTNPIHFNTRTHVSTREVLKAKDITLQQKQSCLKASYFQLFRSVERGKRYCRPHYKISSVICIPFSPFICPDNYRLLKCSQELLNFTVVVSLPVSELLDGALCRCSSPLFREAGCVHGGKQQRPWDRAFLAVMEARINGARLRAFREPRTVPRESCEEASIINRNAQDTEMKADYSKWKNIFWIQERCHKKAHESTWKDSWPKCILRLNSLWNLKIEKSPWLGPEGFAQCGVVKISIGKKRQVNIIQGVYFSGNWYESQSVATAASLTLLRSEKETTDKGH